MAVVADRVIVELEAKLDRYEANMRRAEQRFDAATRNIQRSAKQTEESIRRNTGAIGGQLRQMAGAFAAAFTVQQVASLADTFTRFTNSLKVAGLEGTNLTRIQGQLYDIAQRNGVQMESLGGLYGRAAQNSKELGASNAELVQFTSGVAAALRIEGKSATDAAGALQQLGQLLGSSRIQAEEFNSIVDGARPILVAVANNIDAAGGSVSRLKQLVNDGKISNVEFFNAFLAGSKQVEAQAAKANLTIGNSFTILNNALGMYIGQTDDAHSATERISAAIITLSENLDTVAAALGIISAILLGRFVAGMVGAAAATGIASSAIFALQARAIGAATTMEALGFASAAAGRGMLAAFGGPVGLAIAALSIGLYYLITRTESVTQASAEWQAQLATLKRVQDKTTDATDALASATGKARAEALANAKALQQETQQYLANAKAALVAAQAKAQIKMLQAQQAAVHTQDDFGEMGMGRISPNRQKFNQRRQEAMQADADARAAGRVVTGAQKELDRITAAIKATPTVQNIAPTKTKTPKSHARQGADPEDIARRFTDDMARGQADYEAALAEAVGTVEARNAQARLEIDTENAIRRRAIEADDDLSALQKTELLAMSDKVALARHQAIAAQERFDADQAAVELAQSGLQNDAELLEAQSKLADTSAERRAIALRLLELHYQEERLQLEAIVNNERINAADREIARQRLAMLGKLQELDRRDVERQHEGAGKRYLRDLNAKDINEQLDEVRIHGLQTLEDKIVDVTAKIFKMGGAFGEIANQIIADLIRIAVQRAIIEPLANMMFGGPSGGASGGSSQGGWLSALLNIGMSAIGGGSGGSGGGMFGMNPTSGPIGMASGGHINAGTIYRVNETGIEGFQPAGSGKIIPLGQMNSIAQSAGGAGAPTVVRIMIGASDYFDVRVQSISGKVAVETVQASAPALTELAVAETFRVAGRPGM